MVKPILYYTTNTKRFHTKKPFIKCPTKLKLSQYMNCEKYKFVKKEELENGQIICVYDNRYPDRYYYEGYLCSCEPNDNVISTTVIQTIKHNIYIDFEKDIDKVILKYQGKEYEININKVVELVGKENKWQE